MKRIAVTGASGFVGRHVVRHAVQAGWPCVGLVRSEAGSEAVVRAGGRPCLVGRDLDALPRALDGCDAVVHLAQIGAERGPDTYQAVNIGLTERVAREASRAGAARIVYFSGLGVAGYGMLRRCTNPYFLSKLVAEAALLRSGVETIVFRPSFVVGPGDAFVPMVLRAFERGGLEIPGDGSYRMQPIAVDDAAALVLAALEQPPPVFPTVMDLVGPEPIAYARLLERLSAVARREGRAIEPQLRQVPIAEADRHARAGGFQGVQADELDCLLCDQVSDPAPLVRLLGRPLLPLDDALGASVRTSRPS